MQTLTLLKKLVSIPSAFPNEQEISSYLAEYLQKIGFSVEKVVSGEDRYNIVATYGKSKSYLGFYGHMDTVPNNEELRKDPYTVFVKDGIASALGAGDMKGGIATILQAGEFAVQQNFPLKIIFGVDEENISQGAHDLVKTNLLRDIGFLIVGESGQIRNYNEPFSVCYGRKGRVLFEAIISGKTVHAAESEKGINAIEKAALLVSLMNKMRFRKHNKLGKTNIVVHTINGDIDAFSVPNKCTILFSLITTPYSNSSEFASNLELIAKQHDINLTLKPFKRNTPYGESYALDLKNEFVKTLEREIYKPNSVVPKYADSVADENVFANSLNIPVVSIGPVGGDAHTSTEWVNLNSLDTLLEVYKKIISLYNKN